MVVGAARLLRGIPCARPTWARESEPPWWRCPAGPVRDTRPVPGCAVNRRRSQVKAGHIGATRRRRSGPPRRIAKREPVG